MQHMVIITKIISIPSTANIAPEIFFFKKANDFIVSFLHIRLICSVTVASYHHMGQVFTYLWVELQGLYKRVHLRIWKLNLNTRQSRSMQFLFEYFR